MCPICDWRVKIPRDAARPKLEDLQDWQAEIPGLPFQPEEEQTLARIIDVAQDFRESMQPLINPMVTSPEEVDTQLFYLRKIEGAEVLLVRETNFFRQELHKWNPIAPDPPPVIQSSASTRKPRPTKQQKMMTKMGVERPEDLPLHLRTKHHTFKRKSDEPHPQMAHPLQPARMSNGSGIMSGPNSAGYASSQATPTITQASHIPASSGGPAFTYDNHPPFASPHHSPSYPPPSSFMSPGLNSPGFAPHSPAHPPGLDSSMFSPPRFASSGHGPHHGSLSAEDGVVGQHDSHFAEATEGHGMHDMFADLTNADGDVGMGTSHASEALDAMRTGLD